MPITFDRNYRSLSIIIYRTAACTDLSIVTKNAVLEKKVTSMSLFHEKTEFKTTSTRLLQEKANSQTPSRLSFLSLGFCHSSSCTSCHCRMGMGRCGRPLELNARFGWRTGRLHWRSRGLGRPALQPCWRTACSRHGTQPSYVPALDVRDWRPSGSEP